MSTNQLKMRQGVVCASQDGGEFSDKMFVDVSGSFVGWSEDSEWW